MELSEGIFSSRGLMFILVAQIFSGFGDALVEITLPVWVGVLTRSPGQVAGVATAELLPAMLMSPVAGFFSERLNPKFILIATYLIKAVAVLLLLEFHGRHTVYLAYLVSFLLSLSLRISLPAQSVLLKTVTPSGALATAQGAFRVVSSIALALGPFVGGTLLLRTGSTTTFLLVAAMFTMAALSLTGMKYYPNITVTTAAKKQRGLQPIVRKFREALQHVVTSPEISSLLVVTSSVTVVGFVWFTIDLFYVQHYLHHPGEAVGYLWTASGLGDLVAGLCVTLFAARFNPKWMMVVGLMVRATALGAYALMDKFHIAILVCFVAGWGDGLTATASSVLVMKLTGSGMMGRVTSLLDMTGQTTGMVAMTIVALTGQKFTSREELLWCAFLLFVTACWWIVRQRGWTKL